MTASDAVAPTARRPVKLVIMIPCLNEAEQLPATVAALPKSLPGIDVVELLVIDDGSTDQTVAVARALGVHHVVSHPWNRGLAQAFLTGAAAAIERGADFVVNTDADNQYCAEDIPKLLAPLLENTADLVVGERPIAEIRHFSPVKKLLQRLGSRFVRWLSHTEVRDSPSGFRALTRKAILQTNIFNRFTYTHEMLIAAGWKGLRVKGVPVRVNPIPTRPSRLFESIPKYLFRSGLTIARMYYVYAPAPFFLRVAVLFGLAALTLFGRVLWVSLQGTSEGYVLALVLAALAATFAGLSAALAIVGDMININRRLLEDLQYRLRADRERDREPRL